MARVARSGVADGYGMDPSLRLAVVQPPMRWTTAENLVRIEAALRFAAEGGAALCIFPELALTGYHREIRREAVPAVVEPALERIAQLCERLGLACALGAPAFGPGGAIYDSVWLIDATGQHAGRVDKTGLTVAEATFFHAGRGRPVAMLQGRRVSAVICREIEDVALVDHHLPPGVADLIVWPSLMGRAPHPAALGAAAFPTTDALVRQIARRAQAWVIECNWPEALNAPPDSPDLAFLGGSRVLAPDGRLCLRLPHRRAGIACFELGDSHYRWSDWAEIAGSADRATM